MLFRSGTAVAATGLHLVYFILRWIASGHIPVSNLFEFLTFLSLMVGIAFLVIFRIYGKPLLGAFALPVAFILLSYAMVFPWEAQPLIPSLNSVWLYLHVTLAATGEAFFAIAFAAALMYLLRVIQYEGAGERAQRFFMEIILFAVLGVIGFIFANFTIRTNTVLNGLIIGAILYGGLWMIFRRPFGAVIQRTLKEIDPDDLDEISYRAVAIGFPIFTLGALIFAMIWAHIAWNRFWGWDPKEVWALVTWLFYSAYLHLRLGRGWQGRRSAWLAVVGFMVVLFTLIGVNLFIAGLHSYAGV